MLPTFLKRAVLFYFLLQLLVTTDAGDAAVDREDEAPGIVLTVPVENASEVPTTQSIVVHFSKKIDPRTLTPATFFVEGAEGVLRYNPILKSATWIANAPLKSLKTYTVTLSEKIKDLHGHSLPFSYSWTFATRKTDEQDDPLTIRQTTQPANATHVPVEAAISVTFNKEINPETVRPGLILLTRRDPVEGRLRYNGSARTLIFSPASPLDYGSTYTVTVKEEIEDRDGNPLLLGMTWTFTTETPPPPLATLFP